VKKKTFRVGQIEEGSLGLYFGGKREKKALKKTGRRTEKVGGRERGANRCKIKRLQG